MPPWLTTPEVAAGAGVSLSTVLRWRRLGLLPEPAIQERGRRGRVARWPADTIKRALWIKAQLDAGFSFEEIRAQIQAGEFKD